MNRPILLAGTTLLLVLAGCSSDDEGTPQQSTTANQPGGGNASNAQPNPSNGAMATNPSADISGGTNEAPNTNVNLMGNGGASNTDSAEDTSMSFFVTSVGSGEDGGNLGGLDGADAICQELAEAVDAGDKTWRAYLSTDTVNARDRIGSGPWHNQGGVLIAESLAELHAEDTVFNGAPNLILDENGENAPGPEHDILTGTNADGSAAPGLNCANWTSNDAALTENPRVGHSDIPGDTRFSPSWNAAHASGNCSQVGLTQRGGAGRLYCFAED